MDIETLKKEVALNVGDPTMRQITDSQYLTFINQAARDARSSGWLIHIEEDESIELAENTYEYDIPADFAYLQDLFMEDDSVTPSVYDSQIPAWHWKIGYNDGVPVIIFDSVDFSYTAGDYIKLVGQQRPSLYTVDADTVDAGMEAFLRERAIAYAARFLAGGGSQYDRWRGQLSEIAFRNGEMFLSRHPQEFRQKPNSIHVPGR